jgi:hypothetical protein
LTTSIIGAYGLRSVTVNPTTLPTGDSNLIGINGNWQGEERFTAALSGLQAGATYDVWVFVTRQNFRTNQFVHIAGAGITDFSQFDLSHRQLIVNSMVGSSSETLGFYALPIVSDGSGNINITIYNNDDGVGAAISGIALAQAVPEPATLGLLACGAVSLAAYEWRRRKLATV